MLGHPVEKSGSPSGKPGVTQGSRLGSKSGKYVCLQQKEEFTRPTPIADRGKGTKVLPQKTQEIAEGYAGQTSNSKTLPLIYTDYADQTNCVIITLKPLSFSSEPDSRE